MKYDRNKLNFPVMNLQFSIVQMAWEGKCCRMTNNLLVIVKILISFFVYSLGCSEKGKHQIAQRLEGWRSLLSQTLIRSFCESSTHYPVLSGRILPGAVIPTTKIRRYPKLIWSHDQFSSSLSG